MADPMPQSAWKFRIHGRVQGVGFRWYTQREADRLGVRGWVRNCADGTVEALAIGSSGQVDAFAEAVRKGPAMSRVSSIERTESMAAETSDSFEIQF